MGPLFSLHTEVGKKHESTRVFQWVLSDETDESEGCFSDVDVCMGGFKVVQTGIPCLALQDSHIFAHRRLDLPDAGGLGDGSRRDADAHPSRDGTRNQRGGQRADDLALVLLNDVVEEMMMLMVGEGEGGGGGGGSFLVLRPRAPSASHLSAGAAFAPFSSSASSSGCSATNDVTGATPPPAAAWQTPRHRHIALPIPVAAVVVVGGGGGGGGGGGPNGDAEARHFFSMCDPKAIKKYPLCGGFFFLFPLWVLHATAHTRRERGG